MSETIKSFAQRRVEAYRMGRRRRGDIKAFLLFALNERPMHGYEMIQFFEKISHGLWSPSPGSVYPTLQMLEDGGFVTSKEVEGKKVYSITEEGRKEAERLPVGSFAQDPEQANAITSLRDNNTLVRHLMKHIIREGSVTDLQKASDIMKTARVELSKLVGHYPDDATPYQK
jgi:DNA-binding PadR family transcriptional regulator